MLRHQRRHVVVQVSAISSHTRRWREHADTEAMMQVPQVVNWTQTIANAAMIVVPILLGGYVAWKKLWWVLTEYRPHLHEELEGPLKAERIRYPRTLKNAK